MGFQQVQDFIYFIAPDDYDEEVAKLERIVRDAQFKLAEYKRLPAVRSSVFEKLQQDFQGRKLDLIVHLKNCAVLLGLEPPNLSECKRRAEMILDFKPVGD